MRITLELKLVPVSQTSTPQSTPHPHQHPSQRLTLQAWAEKTFGEYAPRYSTLRKWALDGYISPPPKKSGWIWLVDPNAEYHGKS